MIIGITGGIASGKTMVSNYLAEKGYPVVDADVLSREVMQPGNSVMNEIEKRFGKEMILSDGQLNRTALGELIYNNQEAREQLNALTHPAIKTLAEKKFRAFEEAPLIFFVVPLMYESGMNQLCDIVWLILADESIRKMRLSARDGIDDSYAEKKINSQMTDAERLSYHPVVIRNNGDAQALYQEIEAQLKNLKK